MAWSGLSGVDSYAYRGHAVLQSAEGTPLQDPISFKGNVNAHQEQSFRMASAQGSYASISDRWNPLQQLRVIQQYKHTLEKDALLSNRNVLVLNITLQSGEGTRLLQRSLKQEMERLQTGRYAAEGMQSWAAAKRKAMNDQLQHIYQDGHQVLAKLLKDMQSDTTYRVWIDRSSLLPVRLVSTTITKYVEQGKSREERVMTDAVLENFH